VTHLLSERTLAWGVVAFAQPHCRGSAVDFTVMLECRAERSAPVAGERWRA
jgi:hypothetical protein